jgi:hypothetical protein
MRSIMECISLQYTYWFQWLGASFSQRVMGAYDFLFPFFFCGFLFRFGLAEDFLRCSFTHMKHLDGQSVSRDPFSE